MANLFAKHLLSLGLVVILVAHLSYHNAEGRPQLGGEIDTDDYREARRSPPYTANTFPPFPDDDDYDRYLTDAPSTYRPQTSGPWIISTTSEYTNYNEVERENGNEDNDEGFHKRIIPWFKRQWGKARDLIRTHI